MLISILVGNQNSSSHPKVMEIISLLYLQIQWYGSLGSSTNLNSHPDIMVKWELLFATLFSGSGLNFQEHCWSCSYRTKTLRWPPQSVSVRLFQTVQSSNRHWAQESVYGGFRKGQGELGKTIGCEVGNQSTLIQPWCMFLLVVLYVGNGNSQFVITGWRGCY